MIQNTVTPSRYSLFLTCVVGLSKSVILERRSELQRSFLHQWKDRMFVFWIVELVTLAQNTILSFDSEFSYNFIINAFNSEIQISHQEDHIVVQNIQILSKYQTYIPVLDISFESLFEYIRELIKSCLVVLDTTGEMSIDDTKWGVIDVKSNKHSSFIAGTATEALLDLGAFNLADSLWELRWDENSEKTADHGLGFYLWKLLNCG